MFRKLSRTKSIARYFDEHLAWFNIIVFIMVLVVGLLYIFQVNHSVTKGYEIRDLETKIQDLRVETQDLEIKVAENRSMAAVDEKVKMLGMVRAETPDYVNAGPPTVALNR